MLNGAEYLPDALNSINRQTLLPKEVVIVDDGSSDQSAAIAEAWARQTHFPATVIRRRATGGAPAARNEGLKVSRGRLIQFADADDLLHPRRLELMVGAFDAFPSAEIVWSAFERFSGKHPNFWTDGKPTMCGIERERLPEKIPTLAWSLLFKRDLLDRIGGWDEGIRIWQDFNLALRAAAEAKEGVYVNTVLNYYRQDGKSRISTSRTDRERLRGRLHAVQQTVRSKSNAPFAVNQAVRARINHECYHLFRSSLGCVPQNLIRPLLGRVARGPAKISERMAAVLLLFGSGLAPGLTQKLKVLVKKSQA